MRPDETIAFSISDPHRRLARAKELEIALAWREKSRRIDGRKVYTEGPYELRSTVHWEHRDSLRSSASGPGLAGRFRVAGAEIKIKKLEEWTQEVEILLRVRMRRWRSCLFVLPLDGGF